MNKYLFLKYNFYFVVLHASAQVCNQASNRQKHADVGVLKAISVLA